MTTARALPFAVALTLLGAAPAHACGPSRQEAMLIAAVVLPLAALFLSPLALFALDLLRFPFGLRLGRRGAMARAVLGAGGAALGFWGGLLSSGRNQLLLLAYGAACATVLAYGAAAAYNRRTQ